MHDKMKAVLVELTICAVNYHRQKGSKGRLRIEGFVMASALR
jgi:hypothetical protein